MSSPQNDLASSLGRRLRWPRWLPLVLAAIAAIVFFGVTIEAVRQIGRFIWPVFVPMLVSVALAYVLEPVVAWFERFGLSRTRAIVATLVASGLALVLFVVFVVPRLAWQLAETAEKLPALVRALLAAMQPALGLLRRVNERLYESVNGQIARYVEDPSALTEPIFAWVHEGAGGISGLTTSIFEAILIPFFIYYILRDLPKLRAQLEQLTPPRYRTTTHEIFDRMAAVGQNFIRGQLTICSIMAVLDSIGFLVLGVPMAVLFGVIAGFGHLVPYVGPIAALAATAAYTAVETADWWRVVGVGVVFLAVQAVESVFLTPYILGNRLKLHPFWVLTAIFIAGHVFGILGMILATPTIAMAKVLLLYAQHAYLHSTFYQGPIPAIAQAVEPGSPPAEPTDAYAEASQLAADEAVSPITGDRASVTD